MTTWVLIVWIGAFRSPVRVGDYWQQTTCVNTGALFVEHLESKLAAAIDSTGQPSPVTDSVHFACVPEKP
jgi:hypothetical protein